MRESGGARTSAKTGAQRGCVPGPVPAPPGTHPKSGQRRPAAPHAAETLSGLLSSRDVLGSTLVVAGVAPVAAAGVENVDVGEIDGVPCIERHLDYPEQTSRILRAIGMETDGE